MDAKEAIQFMKENKVLHLRLPDGLELTLAPGALIEAPALPEPSEREDPTLDERGSTGMTRREQIELLGTTFEGDFPRKRK